VKMGCARKNERWKAKKKAINNAGLAVGRLVERGGGVRVRMPSDPM
jgi:hypothetical protein